MKSRIVFLGLALTLSACGGDDADPNGSGMVDCDTNPDTYANFGGSFFATNCNNCHGSNGTDPLAGSAQYVATFDTVDQIRAKEADILQRMFNTELPMPPATAPQPTQADKNRAAAWLNCGAP